MIIHILLGILSIASSGSLYYFTGCYQEWYFIFIFIALLPIFHVVWYGIYVLILFFASLCMPKTTKKVEKPNKVAYWFVRQTCLETMFLFRARIKKTGPDFPDESCLIIQNHTSNFDPMPSIYFGKKQPICCISKPENFNLPIAGKFIHQAGFIPIDRENDFNAIKAIVHATNCIKNNTCSVFVCPEGTRNKHPEDGLMEFKAGCFKIAYKSKCPIVVIANKNSNVIHKNFLYKHTNVYLDILEVIPYEKYKDMSSIELADYCKGLIQAKLAERS